jgi:hypothetical protein
VESAVRASPKSARCTPRICCLAALAPAVRLRVVDRTVVSDGLRRITVSVENHGYLPTCVLASAAKLDFNEPLWARAEARGCALVDPGDAIREVGHLDGWGRGLGGGEEPLAYGESKGSSTDRRLTYLVRGEGTLSLRVGSCRTGWIRTRGSDRSRRSPAPRRRDRLMIPPARQGSASPKRMPCASGSTRL